MSGNLKPPSHLCLSSVQPKLTSAATSRSCKLSTFWKPSPFLEEHNPPDKTSPAVTLQFLPVPDALLAPHRLPFSDKLFPPARPLPMDFPTWTPGVNPHIYDRTSQPFSDQHRKPSLLPPHILCSAWLLVFPCYS
ncbi:hypothetical protein AMECASPLE_012762 [Ameca splendens]|uniref:Uncharacterized protein n=1 Tax=Ameca splendens TaxID=208324 RepID=A0ABV0XE82_9TELE